MMLHHSYRWNTRRLLPDADATPADAVVSRSLSRRIVVATSRPVRCSSVRLGHPVQRVEMTAATTPVVEFWLPGIVCIVCGRRAIFIPKHAVRHDDSSCRLPPTSPEPSRPRAMKSPACRPRQV